MQTDRTSDAFTVAPLSFFIADVRMHRSDNFSSFLAPGDMEKLSRWVKGLKGPGVLCLGQPLLVKPKKTGAGRKLIDSNLADHKQYGALVKALRRSEHDIVMVTGDVHLGRIAETPLNPSAGARLIEVIASPMALVDVKAANSWEIGKDKSPSKFPHQAIAGVRQTKIKYLKAVRLIPKSGVKKLHEETEPHFMTIGFDMAPNGKVRIQATPWLTRLRRGAKLPRKDWTWTDFLQ